MIYFNVPFGVIIFLHFILMQIFIKLFRDIRALPILPPEPDSVFILERFFK